MINIKDKSMCCGCSACVNICPKKCIAMCDDEEGFGYPIVDRNNCVNCGLCEETCPFQHSQSENQILKSYGAESNNELIRKQSSCGGMFSIFAQKIIDEKGVVCACKLDEQLSAIHSFARTLEELEPMRNSKYVQSRLDDTFLKIKELLDKGTTVLFSGMPCQVAGLKRFLKKPYENLITIDVLCHGVPSPKLFKDYLLLQESQYDSAVSSVNFRDKSSGWRKSAIHVGFQNNRNYYKYCGVDMYLSLYSDNLSQRLSCFKCPFTTTQRQGDISIGDFGVVGSKAPYTDDNKGTTLVLINNTKGQKLFDSIKDFIVCYEIDVDIATEGNAVLSHPLSGIERRNSFYETYIELGFQKAFNIGR